MLIKIVIGIFLANFAIASSVISVVKVPGNVLGIKVKSRAWMSTNFKKLNTFPMASINTNDTIANRLNFQNGVRTVEIKAIYDGKDIAFLLKWKDKTKNIITKRSTDIFNDAFGIELQTKTDVVPYVDFGDKNNEVVFYLKNSSENTIDIGENRDLLSLFDYQNLNIFAKTDNLPPYVKQEVFLYRGYNNAIKLDKEVSNITMDMVYSHGYWYGSLSKKLIDKNSNLSNGAFLVSFSLYDGEKRQRGRLRNLTHWVVVKLAGTDGGEQLIEQINQTVSGDIKHGESLALKNCSICHNYKDRQKAPQNMAPNLSYIGGYLNMEYIKESILQPSKVIVSDFTDSAHPNFSWKDKEDGKNISVMPSFEWMNEKDLNDLLAFLQTLR
jgi:complex iron-sulfur molybdoenzyme family reductase subunit gamma